MNERPSLRQAMRNANIEAMDDEAPRRWACRRSRLRSPPPPPKRLEPTEEERQRDLDGESVSGQH